jgi:hypothetical protein
MKNVYLKTRLTSANGPEPAFFFDLRLATAHSGAVVEQKKQ